MVAGPKTPLSCNWVTCWAGRELSQRGLTDDPPKSLPTPLQRQKEEVGTCEVGGPGKPLPAPCCCPLFQGTRTDSGPATWPLLEAESFFSKLFIRATCKQERKGSSLWGGEGLHGQIPAPGRLTLNSGLCYGPSGVSGVEPATARAAASSTLHQPLLAPLQHPAHQCQPWTAAPIRQTPARGGKTTWHRRDLSQSQGCSALGRKKGVHPTATVQTLTPHTSSESSG